MKPREYLNSHGEVSQQVPQAAGGADRIVLLVHPTAHEQQLLLIDVSVNGGFLCWCSSCLRAEIPGHEQLNGEGVQSEFRILTVLVGTCWGQELEVGRDVMVAGAWGGSSCALLSGSREMDAVLSSFSPFDSVWDFSLRCCPQLR